MTPLEQIFAAMGPATAYPHSPMQVGMPMQQPQVAPVAPPVALPDNNTFAGGGEYSGVGAAPPGPSAYQSPVADPFSMQGFAGKRPLPAPPTMDQLLYEPSNIPVPSRKPEVGGTTPSAPASPSAPARASGGGMAGPPAASPAQSPMSPGPSAQQGVPSASSGPLLDPMTSKFLLQTGLSMMVPKWGGPLANIAQSVGEGAEAVDRSTKSQQEREMSQKKIELEQARIDKMGTGGRRSKATESSGSKRLKAKTPMQSMAEGMSPEAAVYFSQRIKDLNKIGEDDGETPEAKYSKLMQETQNVDRRARERKGMVRSDEISDKQINAIAGNPALETQALTATAADPVQRAALASRLEAAKQAKAKATDGKSTAAK